MLIYLLFYNLIFLNNIYAFETPFVNLLSSILFMSYLLVRFIFFITTSILAH